MPKSNLKLNKKYVFPEGEQFPLTTKIRRLYATRTSIVDGSPHRSAPHPGRQSPLLLVIDQRGEELLLVPGSAPVQTCDTAPPSEPQLHQHRMHCMYREYTYRLLLGLIVTGKTRKGLNYYLIGEPPNAHFCLRPCCLLPLLIFHTWLLSQNFPTSSPLSPLSRRSDPSSVIAPLLTLFSSSYPGLSLSYPRSVSYPLPKPPSLRNH